MKLQNMRDNDKALTRQLKDPHFRAEWERTAVARAVAARLVEYRVEHGLSQTALGAPARHEAAGRRTPRGR